MGVEKEILGASGNYLKGGFLNHWVTVLLY